MVAKDDIRHAISFLARHVEAATNGYIKSLLEQKLKQQNDLLAVWDNEQLVLSEFVDLVQSHNVYSKTFDMGYGEGSETTWFVDGKPLTDSIRFLDVDIYENYDVLINETDETIDQDTYHTHYSYNDHNLPNQLSNSSVFGSVDDE